MDPRARRRKDHGGNPGQGHKHRLLSNQYNDSVRLQMESQLDEDSDFEPAIISSDGFDTIIEQECNKGVNPDLLLALSDLVKEG